MQCEALPPRAAWQLIGKSGNGFQAITFPLKSRKPFETCQQQAGQEACGIP